MFRKTLRLLVLCAAATAGSFAVATAALPDMSRPIVTAAEAPKFLFPDRTSQSGQFQQSQSPQVQAPQVQAPQQQQIGPPPAAGSGVDDWLKWVWTAMGGVVTALLARLTLKPAQSGDVLGEFGNVKQVVGALLSPQGSSLISDPRVKAAFDQVLLQLVQSGTLGGLITGGAGLVPGAAPIVGIVEPMVRRAVEAGLEKRLGAAAPVTSDDHLSGKFDLMQSMLGQILNVLKVPKAT